MPSLYLLTVLVLYPVEAKIERYIYFGEPACEAKGQSLVDSNRAVNYKCERIKGVKDNKIITE